MKLTIKHHAWLSAALLACALLGLPAHAASFDCAKAQRKVEKLICGSPELSSLDNDLADSYGAALQNQANVEATRRTQTLWLKERNECTNAACLKRKYQTRVQALLIGMTGAEKLPKNRQGKKPVEQYQLAMSEDDAVCKPVLAEYNRDIPINQLDLPSPHVYPRPTPPVLALPWQEIHWEMQAADTTYGGNGYSIVKADSNQDGQPETIVRWATWARGDDRFTALQIFPDEFLIPKQVREFKQTQFQKLVANIVPGGYHLSKLKASLQVAELNDFDVIQFNGKHYVTGDSASMSGIDSIVEDQDAPRWRVIGRIRFGKSPSRADADFDLDWTLDGICYFLARHTK